MLGLGQVNEDAEVSRRDARLSYFSVCWPSLFSQILVLTSIATSEAMARRCPTSPSDSWRMRGTFPCWKPRMSGSLSYSGLANTKVGFVEDEVAGFIRPADGALCPARTLQEGGYVRGLRRVCLSVPRTYEKSFPAYMTASPLSSMLYMRSDAGARSGSGMRPEGIMTTESSGSSPSRRCSRSLSC